MIARTSKAYVHIETTTEETTTTIEGSNPAQDKGKMKIVDDLEGNKRCKVMVDLIIKKESWVVEEKR